MNLRNPGNTMPYKTIWAIVSIDKNGNEGFCAINTFIGPQLAVTGEPKLLDIYKKTVGSPTAIEEAKRFGKKIMVAEYTRTGTKELSE